VVEPLAAWPGRDDAGVPRIRAFYGIVITMYCRDHRPPHFHAIYGEYEAQIVIETLEPLAGELPTRALRLVHEWGRDPPRRAGGELGAGRSAPSPGYDEPLP
jgi:hypothetical protein